MGLPDELVAYYAENPERFKKDIDDLKGEDQVHGNIVLP